MQLCELLEQERHENLSDTVEAKIIQAIIDLESGIERGLLEAKKIADRINEGQLEKFKKSQSAITRICKSMGFKASRPKGKTHIEVDKKLLEKLATRYLRKNAQSAPTALDEEKQHDSECTFGAANTESQEKCTQSVRKVHPITDGNHKGSAGGAESAENQGAFRSKKETADVPEEVII